MNGVFWAMNEHYKQGHIQPIDAITDWNLGYNAGSAVAYIARHEYKGAPESDLRKAIWHLVYELTQNTELCDNVVTDVEAATIVEWVEPHEEYGVVPGSDYIDSLTRYAVVTDGRICFDSDDYLEASAEYDNVSNEFHCSHAEFIDRGDGFSVYIEPRVISEWVWVK
jgi:hypothetical protein